MLQGHFPLHWAALNNRTAELELLISVRTFELPHAIRLFASRGCNL